MNYAEAIAWLHTLPDFERTGEFSPRDDVSLMLALLAELGDPHRGRPTVHIAGSKGKGSTGAMLDAMLRAAGARTGYYVSPHLHRYTERIRIDGEPIEQEAFASAMARVRDAMGSVAQRTPDRAFVAFDALTAAGFVAFGDANVDVQIVEVGLGGRLDPTNVFHGDESSTSHVVALTPISLEHTAVLGDTIAAIAGEKAGIITQGATVVVAPQRESALDVFRAVCAERNATMLEVASTCQMNRTAATAEHQDFKLRTPHETYSARLPLLGRHQLDNAATAILAAETIVPALGVELTPEHVRAGLAGVSWPGRLEVLRRKPLIIIDGAHNGDSAKRMVAALREHFGLTQATLLFGTLAGKDVAAMADATADIASEVFTTGWPSRRAADPREAASAFRERGALATAMADLGQAFEAACAHAGERGAVVAFGSLSFVAAVREYLLGIESDMIMEAPGTGNSAHQPSSIGP